MNQSLQSEISQVMPQAAATGLYRSLATFQQPDGTQGPTGEPSGAYTPVDGLVNIPCMDAPSSMMFIRALEERSVADILAKGLRHVALNGYYPAVIAGWRQGWRVLIDGTAYDILGAEADSQRTQTRMELQLASL
jgi:hypothetical protein